MEELLAAPQVDAPPADDVSALAWVHGELRRTLENAHKALRRYLKEAEALGGSDVDAADPASLRNARAQLHQGVGALELVGLPAPAQLLRASEAAVQRMIAKPALVTAQAVDAVEHASFALLDFLSRVLAGKAPSPVALFPQYRAALQLAGADRVHPADLWPVEFGWREVPRDSVTTPRRFDDATREVMESLVLALMRHPDRTTQQQLSDLCADLAAGAAAGGTPAAERQATQWQLAAAFFEAQSHGLLAADVYTKRLASRLLAQMRATVSGSDEISERLAHDLLFFCAHARPPSARVPAPRLGAVRYAWKLDDSIVADYETPRLGRFDPAWIAQARKRVASARDAWSAVAGGELHRLAGLGEQFSLVGDSLQRLFPAGDLLAGALQTAVSQTLASAGAPPAPLAMEVATSILYVDASLEDGELDHPDLAGRVQRLARRIDEVRAGREPQPLEAWMEELYRRVSDRQTMGSVVQELRSSLSEIEKQIDQYFRDPAQRQLLIPVPGQLQAMRGVLSVLGLDQASHAVLRMRDDIDALAQTEVDPQLAVQAGTFDRLADNLGALSFLIDMLSVQPALAKSLFRFDPELGVLAAVMGQSERPSAFAAFDTTQASTVPGRELVDQAQDLAATAARADVPDAEVAQALERLAQQAQAADQPALARAMASAQQRLAGAGDDDARAAARSELADTVARLAPLPDLPPPVPAPVALPLADDEDAEMREIFIEEAQEVVANARAALGKLAAQPDDQPELTAVRRAFHTLKGSSRMVGLDAFGEAAWACEQLYNAHMAETRPMDEGLALFTGEALDYLGAWVEAVAAGRDDGHASAPVVHAADALRLRGERVPLAAPGAEPADADAGFSLSLHDALPVQSLQERVPDLPSAADLDLAPAPVAEPAPLDDLRFDLDLGEPAPAAPLADLPPLPAADPAVPPVGEAVEFSLSQFDFGAFDAPAAPPAAEPLPEPVPEPEPVAQSEPLPESEPEPWDVELNPPAAEALFGPLPPLAMAFDWPAPAAEPEPEPAAAEDDDEQVKVIGPLRISIPLFNIYLNEADEQSRRLGTELAEWAHEHERRPVPDSAAALAHSLAGNSATVGYAELSALARALEHALLRSQAVGRGRGGEPELFSQAADEIRRLLHQFAAGFLRPVAPELMAQLHDHEQWPVPAPPLTPAATLEDEAAVEAEDVIDDELLPVFIDEADELLPQLQARLREWAGQPADRAAASACMRTLHTFKGSARLAGAMRVGEMAHRLETEIEELLAQPAIEAGAVEPLLARSDAMLSTYEALRGEQLPSTPALVLTAPPTPAPAAPAPAPAEPVVPAITILRTLPAERPRVSAEVLPEAQIDWSRFATGPVAAAQPAERAAPASNAVVRVRGSLLDRMVNQAGEVSIARARIESDVKQLQGSLADLTESLERLRRQLRDIEVQAETQMTTRLEAAKAHSESFDPLEMDRFTRFQELTRFMAESVNDVATLQRGLQRTLQSTEDQLAAQTRLTRDLQDDLLRTRMIEFDSLADRLYRVVRQAAKDTGKQVRLDITGGSIDIDRGVLERMTGPFEHLLRNCVVHGIEAAAQRTRAGKDATGLIAVTVTQEGNEVGVEVRDDGAGLDLARIRARAVERGLLAADAQPSDGELAQLIFAPGFTTADAVTELAGRGVGMDVVRSEVDAMGGRVQTLTEAGRGTTFRLLLPLTTAVTQVVMLRCDELSVAVPSTLVEVVRRVGADEIEAAYASGRFTVDGEELPFYWLGALLQGNARGAAVGRTVPVAIIRSAAQRVALHVDDVAGNQEVVVKHVGPQLARMPGLAGVTLLPSGRVALIYNPVALVTLYGAQARERLAQAAQAPHAPDAAPAGAAALAPLVMVVDDSLTVRRVTQRLLVREGYRVVTAKDGLEALEKLAQERPAVLLSDIEMPRMDGFDLARNVRAEPALAGLPIVMITSRIAQKHRDYAATLGVDHYLGKPYAEEELLALVAGYARGRAA